MRNILLTALATILVPGMAVLVLPAMIRMEAMLPEWCALQAARCA